MASKGDAALFLLFLLGISLAGSYVLVYGSLLIDELDENAVEAADAGPEGTFETVHYQLDVTANAGAAGRCVFLDRMDVMKDRPGEFSGILVEAKVQSFAYEPTIQRLRIIVMIDDVKVAETHGPDDRGVFAVLVAPHLWPHGQLSIIVCPPSDEKLPTAIVASRVHLYITFFRGEEMIEGFSAVPDEDPQSSVVAPKLRPWSFELV